MVKQCLIVDAEVSRWHAAYLIAHDQAMKNGAEAAALREALKPFARLAIMDGRLSGLDPDQIRHHVAQARAALGWEGRQ